MKRRINKILTVSKKPGDLSWYFDVFIITLIILNVIAIVLESIEPLRQQFQTQFAYFEIFSVLVFTVEYILRVWTANLVPQYNKPIAGNLRYALTPLAVIGIGLFALPTGILASGFSDEISLRKQQDDCCTTCVQTIKSKFDALHFENANGDDLYIYPAFIAIVDNNKNFGLISIREIDFDFLSLKFLEEEGVPSDSKVIGNTWAKVNKNGSPDKRFKNNYQIPICLYGNIEIKSKTGLNEAYSFSDLDKAELFVRTFKTYQKTIEQ